MIESKTEIDLNIIDSHDGKKGNRFLKSMTLKLDENKGNMDFISNAKWSLINLYEGVEYKDKERLKEAKEFIDELINSF